MNTSGGVSRGLEHPMPPVALLLLSCLGPRLFVGRRKTLRAYTFGYGEVGQHAFDFDPNHRGFGSFYASSRDTCLGHSYFFHSTSSGALKRSFAKWAANRNPPLKAFWKCAPPAMASGQARQGARLRCELCTWVGTRYECLNREVLDRAAHITPVIRRGRGSRDSEP